MASNNPVFYISGEKSYYVPELNLTVDDADTWNHYTNMTAYIITTHLFLKNVKLIE